MGDGLKRAKKAAAQTAREFPKTYMLTISFDSSKLRGEFVEWLRGEQGAEFASMVGQDRGSHLDIDYDSEELVVVNEHAR